MKKHEREERRKQLRFGHYYSIYNMPSITLECNYDWKGNLLPEGEWRTCAYLCSFRNYCWQVCGTFDGEGDYGSTPVFGLDTVGSIVQRGNSNLGQESTVKYIIGCIAMDAINNYLHSWGREGVSGPRHNLGWLGQDEEWKRFIDNCYRKYVVHEAIEDCPLSEEEDQEEAI